MPPLSVPRRAGRLIATRQPHRELAGSGDGPQGDQGPVARRGGGALPLAAGCGPAGDAGPRSRRGDRRAVRLAGPVFPCHWPRLGGLRVMIRPPVAGIRVPRPVVALPRRRARGRVPCRGGGVAAVAACGCLPGTAWPRQMTRSVLRLGTGTVALGWTVPDGGGPRSVVTVVPCHTARAAGVRRGCRVLAAGGAVDRGCWAPFAVVTGVQRVKALAAVRRPVSGRGWMVPAGPWALPGQSPCHCARAVLRGRGRGAGLDAAHGPWLYRLAGARRPRGLRLGTGMVACGWTVPDGPGCCPGGITGRPTAAGAGRRDGEAVEAAARPAGAVAARDRRGRRARARAPGSAPGRMCCGLDGAAGASGVVGAPGARRARRASGPRRGDREPHRRRLMVAGGAGPFRGAARSARAARHRSGKPHRRGTGGVCAGLDGAGRVGAAGRLPAPALPRCVLPSRPRRGRVGPWASPGR